MKRSEIAVLVCLMFAIFAINIANADPLIVDHSFDPEDISPSLVEQVKTEFRISYGHTSHGSQLISGLSVMRGHDSDLYDYTTNGSIRDGALSIQDGYPYGDLGNPNRTEWAARTREMLNVPDNDRNLVMWSWCGQVSGASESDIDTYLSLMNELEIDFPEVTFVYMTGHLDGSGESGNLHLRNEQIRQYCLTYDKILFDFADIESYDPDGEYFLDRGADDSCNYNGGNWADEWCAANPGVCSNVSCSHSRSLNCDRKGAALWYLLTKLVARESCIDGVTDLAATGDAEVGEIVLSWSDISGEDSYVVQRFVDGLGWNYYYETLPANTTSFTDSGLGDGSYKYRIMAHANDNGEGIPCDALPSNPVTIVFSTSPPESPTSLTATSNDFSIALHWQDNSQEEENYVIERSIDAGEFVSLVVLGADTTSYTDTNLPPGHTYSYQIKAVNSFGDSGFSNQASRYIAEQDLFVRLENTSQVEDSFIYENNPDQNYGASNYQGEIDRYLMKFNLPPELMDKKIIDAKVAFYGWHQQNWQLGQYLDLYQVTTHWEEGEVTWNSPCSCGPWSVPGGDFDSTPVGQSEIIQGVDHAFYPEIDITSLVQEWSDGTNENNGLILVNDSHTSIGLKASEYNNGSRTYLEITYEARAIDNLPPTANAGEDQMVEPGEVVTLDGSGSLDQDGDIESYFWEQLTGPEVAVLDVDSVQASFVMPEWSGGDQELTFKLTVEDDTGLTHSDECLVRALDEFIPQFQFESDVIGITHEWKRVQIKNSFVDPIVVAKPASSKDSEHGVIRIRDVDATGFSVRFQEWDYLDDIHDQEQVSYLVMERGHFQLADGSHVEAGSFFTNDMGWNVAGVSFSGSFPKEPVVFASLTTVNEEDAASGRMWGVNNGGFKFKLQEQEANVRSHGQEEVSYIAWEPSTGTIDDMAYTVGRTDDLVNHHFYRISFNGRFNRKPFFVADIQTTNGGDTSSLRITNHYTGGVQVKIDEEKSKDDEVSHTTEVVGFLALEPQESFIPSPPESPNLTVTGPTEITLQWGAATDDGGEVTYLIGRLWPAIIVETSETSFVDNAIIPGQTYYYVVYAVDQDGNMSTLTEILTVTVPEEWDSQSPSIPTGLHTTSVTASQIDMAWLPSSDDRGVTGYTVYRDGIELDTITQPSFVDNGLSAETAYSYQVRAFDGAGNISGLSNALQVTTSPVTHSEVFSFVVFGDLNGGGCERNDRVNRIVQMMAANEDDAAFFMSTGDVTDGYGTTSCFAADPGDISGGGCNGDIPNGNMAEILAPIKERAPVSGLVSSFYMAIGNHDDNWGSGWYPDPCGGGICEFLAPLTPADFINHPFDQEAMCSLDGSSHEYSNEFYYSFTFGNSYFIFLRQNNDYFGMLSCNNMPEEECAAYCADESLVNDPYRNSICYSVEQFDWLRSELQQANQQGYEHIFVAAHAPLITGSDNHNATHGHAQIRALLEQYNVDIFFNGHNHAYERTHPLNGESIDENGTVYITTGSGGASTNGHNRAWFTAFNSDDFVSYGESGYADKMSTYLRITVNGDQVNGELFSLGLAGQDPQDVFQLNDGNPDPQLDISAVQVSGLTSDSATISWVTSVPATGEVAYGASSGNLSESFQTSSGINHSVSLTSLEAETTYYYTITANTGTLQDTTSVASFTTAALPQDNQVQRIGGCQIFPADNMWNTPIDQLDLHPLSDTYVQSIGGDTWVHPDFGTEWNGYDIGIPFDIIPDNQPFVDVQFNYWDETDPLDLNQQTKPYPIPANPSIEGGGDNYTLNGDNHILLIRQDSCILYELFAAYKDSNDNWQAGSGAIWHLDQNEVRPEGVTSADAAGLAILPGLIRYEEVFGDAPQGIEPGINHALRVTLNTIQRGYIRPASHSDGQGSHDPSYPPMGLRLRLKADFDISGFDAPIQVIMRAMKKYGLVIADTGGDMFVSGVHDDRWDDNQLRQLRQITASDFEAVYTGEVVDY